MREISPISIKHGKVRARCYSSNAVKTFIVEKIQIVDTDGVFTAPTWKVRKLLPDFSSLSDAGQKLLPALEGLGWHVEYGEHYLSLHRGSKHGVPLKDSVVSVSYVTYGETTFRLVLTPDGVESQQDYRNQPGPWTVRAENYNTSTFGKMEQAISKFLQYAKDFSPNKNF